MPPDTFPIPIHAKKIILVDPKKIKLNKRNYNTHPDSQIQNLCDGIKYYGFRDPVVVSNLNGVCPEGEGRILAAIKLGMPKIPVIPQDFDNDELQAQYGVFHNAVAKQSELDLSKINIGVVDWGPEFDVDLLGIKGFEIEPADKYGGKDADATPEIRSTEILRGDLFGLGNHRLLCGDSTDSVDVSRLMNGEKAAMWSSDPPYGINHVEVSQEKKQSKGYKKIENDDLRDEEFKDFIFKVIDVSKPYMQEGFAFYMWHAMKMQGYTAAAAAAAAAGILFHRQIIWVKPSLVFGRGQYHWRHELCLMGWLKGNEPPFYGERNQTTVWEIGRENDKIHPTQKPVAIWEAPIKNHTKVKEIVYEPFCGSGSQIIACEKTGRRCFAMELEPLYVQQTIDRFEKFTGQKAIKISDKPVVKNKKKPETQPQETAKPA